MLRFVKRLDVFNRSSGCILPNSHSSGQQEVSKVLLSSGCIPVQGPLLWSFNSSSSLHSYDGSNIKNSSRMGHSNSEIPRRLANFVSITRNHPSCKGQSVTFMSDTRNSCQSFQVSSRTNNVSNLSGDPNRLFDFEGFPDRSPTSETSEFDHEIFKPQSSTSPVLATTAGTLSLPDATHSRRQIAWQVHSDRFTSTVEFPSSESLVFWVEEIEEDLWWWYGKRLREGRHIHSLPPDQMFWSNA